MVDTVNLIQHAVNDSPTQMQDDLNTLMLDKIKDIIDQKRVEVAQNFFNYDEPEDNEEELEDYSDQEEYEEPEEVAYQEDQDDQVS